MVAHPLDDTSLALGKSSIVVHKKADVTSTTGVPMRTLAEIQTNANAHPTTAAAIGKSGPQRI